MTDIVIAAAARTPVGSFSGGLSSVPAQKQKRAPRQANDAQLSFDDLMSS